MKGNNDIYIRHFGFVAGFSSLLENFLSSLAISTSPVPSVFFDVSFLIFAPRGEYYSCSKQRRLVTL